MKKSILLLSVLMAMNAVADNTFYGSINVGLEYRDIKDDDRFDDHVQLQDAYSAIGVMGEQELKPGITGFYNYKVAIDVVKGNLYENEQTTWAGSNQDENVAYVGVKGAYGSASIGYQWNAYYNAISWTTDRFSSGWTGFDTYASFQLSELMVYQSPNFNGLSFALNAQSGVDESETLSSGAANPNYGKTQERFIAAVSYNIGEITAHAAYDDLGSGSTELMGFAVEYNASNMRFAAKHEINKDGLGTDDASITSLHGSFTSGKNTFKVHYAFGNYASYLPVDDAENEGSEIGLGIDHAINDSVYVFAEYHMSDEYCAYDVTEGNGNGGYDDAGDDGIAGTADDVIGNEVYGCQVLSAGVHYSF